jgi:oxygen-dependent protoporphyrinogen oxidase
MRISTRRYVNFLPLSEIHYPPVSALVLGFRREDVAHPLDGFGVLIPEIERFNILGTVFSSSLFPKRAPAGHVTLTSYIGGTRAPHLAASDVETLVNLTLQDLRVLLAVRGEPTFVHHCYFQRAIPQYEVGYGRFKALMEEIEANAPGLFLAGHYRDGISLGDSIVSGCQVADKVSEFLVRHQTRPLTLTLSPSEGERESGPAPGRKPACSEREAECARFSLAPSDGERAGVRGTTP